MYFLKLLWIVHLVVTVLSAEQLKGDYPPISFTCPPLPPLTRPARNVYELRPQDIKVVMALGDSITAGKLTCCSESPVSSHGGRPLAVVEP